MRDKAIDLAKGLGSVWIILSHTGSYFPFAKYFYYMYVPIFFVCSGYTFRKRDSLKADFINVFNRLFIPMLLCRLCMIIFDLLSGWGGVLLSGDVCLSLLLCIFRL